jgi:hypothetical protein
VQPAEVHKWGGEGRQNVHIKRGLDKRGGVRDLESEHKDMAVAIVMRVWCSVGRLGRGGLKRGEVVWESERNGRRQQQNARTHTASGTHPHRPAHQLTSDSPTSRYCGTCHHTLISSRQ